MNTASVELPASGDPETSSGYTQEIELANPGVIAVCSEGVLNGCDPIVIDDASTDDAANEHNAVQALHNASVIGLTPSAALTEAQVSLVSDEAVTTSTDLKAEVSSASLPAHYELSAEPAFDEPVHAVAIEVSPVSQIDLSADQQLATELRPLAGSKDSNGVEPLSKPSDQSSSPQCRGESADEASKNCTVEQAASDVVRHLLKCVENGEEDDSVIVMSTIDLDQQSQSVSIKNVGAGFPPKCSPRKAHVPTKVRLVPYRVHEEDTSSDSSSSSSSDSDDDVVATAVVRRRISVSDSDCAEGDDVRPVTAKRRGPRGKPAGSRSAGLKTPGELDIDDLPPIEDLHITLPCAELRKAGRVRHAVNQLLVVESEPGQPVLDIDSVLFRADGTALGRVFDVLGPVAAPYYTVRFNSAEELAERGLEPGEPLLYAPLHADVTQYVLESEVRKQRGSDASWENNNEPPPEHLDFSDDEQEREARKQLRASRSGGSAPAASAGGFEDRIGGGERQHAPRGRARGGASRGGSNRNQQQRQSPDTANGAMWPCMEGPPTPRHLQDSHRPHWPPSQGPQQRWSCSPAAIRFRPSMLSPSNSQAPPWAASPHGNNSMPNVWNTPPPPVAAGGLLPTWRQNRPFFNQPPVFPNMRTPPPNFGRPMPQMRMPPPCAPQGPFPAHHELCISPCGGQHAAAMNLLHPSPLPSPVYNSAGQRVPLYDPVPDLNRILTSPPP